MGRMGATSQKISDVFAYQRDIRSSDLPKEVKLLLLMLSTYWSPDGEIYPSVTLLAQQCGVKRRALHLTLNKAESLGWLTRQPRPGTSSIINLCNPLHTPTQEVGSSLHTPCAVHCTPPVQSTAHNITIYQTRDITIRDEEPKRVQWLRSEVASRWDAIVPATTAQIQSWCEALPGPELSMAVDAVQRKIDFAHSKGNPISTARRGWHICDTLETHSKFRPNKTTEQDLTGIADKKDDTNEDATNAWQAFLSAKGIE